jgi:menaquinone-9 beta-reductase
VNTVDIAVVGGGPAGAATACGLAAAGREVVLLERSAGPHHKVCGEFLSPDTIAHLGRLAIDPDRLGAIAIDRVTVTTAKRSSTAPLPFQAFSLSRYRLDQTVLRQAVRAGAELRQGVSVQSAEPAASGWRLRCDDRTEIRCRCIVLATGKWPLRGLADRRDGSMVGLKMHLKLPAAGMRALEGRVELFLLDHGYVGLEPVEEGTANLCLIFPHAVAAQIGQGWTALRRYLASENPPLAERLAGSGPQWDRPLAVVCPAGGHVLRRPAVPQDGLFPVGDRLAHIPPFAGDGLGIALSSARIAVDHICRGLPPEAYLEAARSRIVPAVHLAAIVSRLSRSRLGRTAITHAAARAPALFLAVARRTRLSPPNALCIDDWRLRR